MSKYAELDNEILASIRLKYSRLYQIVARTRAEERAVDRRLQALRKQGKVRFVAGEGWVLCA